MDASPSMHDDKSVHIPSVTRELNWQARRDYIPRNLAMLHRTKEVVGIPSSLSRHESGCAVGQCLDAAATFMEGREFLGTWYDARTMRSAVRIQLGREKSKLTLVDRHDFLMQLLDLYYTEQTWRKKGYRLTLLECLAEQVVGIKYQTTS